MIASFPLAGPYPGQYSREHLWCCAGRGSRGWGFDHVVGLNPAQVLDHLDDIGFPIVAPNI